MSKLYQDKITGIIATEEEWVAGYKEWHKEYYNGKTLDYANDRNWRENLLEIKNEVY